MFLLFLKNFISGIKTNLDISSCLCSNELGYVIMFMFMNLIFFKWIECPKSLTTFQLKLIKYVNLSIVSTEDYIWDKKANFKMSYSNLGQFLLARK